MSLLNKGEIEQLLDATPSLIDGFDINLLGGALSPVQPSSLDLTIGDIFVPGTKNDELGGPLHPRTSLNLEQGRTALLRTKERLRMPADVGAIGFPASTSVSLAGLLTTNPGHVDPNYHGHLHLTVINMGRQPFALKQGDRILRLLLFRLSTSPGGKPKAPPSPVTEELLAKLSPDFLDISERAGAAAQRAVASTQVVLPIVSALSGIVLAAFGIWYAIVQNDAATGREISALQARVAQLDGQLNPSGTAITTQALADRISRIEVSISQMQNAPRPQ